MVISLSPGTEELLSASFQTNLPIWVGGGYISKSRDERGETPIYLAEELLHEKYGLRNRFALSLTLCELLLLYPVLKDV